MNRILIPNQMVAEINMFQLGPSNVPHLVVIVADQMLIYKYRHCQIRYPTEQPVLSGRFLKQTSKSTLLRQLNSQNEEKAKQRNNKNIRLFDNIGGYQGFFLSGPYSFWVFAGQSGRLSVHTMWQDGQEIVQNFKSLLKIQMKFYK